MSVFGFANGARFIRVLLGGCALLILTGNAAIAAQDSHDRLLRAMAHAILGKYPANLQRLLTQKNIRRLNDAERSDLMIGLIEHKSLAGLAAAIQSGLDPNQPLHFDREGESISLAPLNFALGAHDDAAMAMLLIDLGADVNRMSVDDNPPVLTAVGLQASTVVKRLLAAGANPNATDKLIQMTPLMVAAGNRNNHSGALEIAQLLFKHGAEVNAETSTGHTALIFAAQANNRAVVEWLLQNGADAARGTANGGSLNTLLNNTSVDQEQNRLLDLLNSLDR